MLVPRGHNVHMAVFWAYREGEQQMDPKQAWWHNWRAATRGQRFQNSECILVEDFLQRSGHVLPCRHDEHMTCFGHIVAEAKQVEAEQTYVAR